MLCQENKVFLFSTSRLLCSHKQPVLRVGGVGGLGGDEGSWKADGGWLSAERVQRVWSEGLKTEVIHLLVDLCRPREHGQPSAHLLLKQGSRTSPLAARNTAKQLLKP